MKEYLLCIIGTVLFCAILTAIIPDGKTSGIIKGVTRLVCVLAIITPITAILQKKENDKISDNLSGIFGETVIQTDTDFINYYSEMRISETERRLAEELQERFGVNTVVELDWELQPDTIKITRIRVTGDGMGEEKMKVWEYLTKNYCSEVWIE